MLQRKASAIKALSTFADVGVITNIVCLGILLTYLSNSSLVIRRNDGGDWSEGQQGQENLCPPKKLSSSLKQSI